MNIFKLLSTESLVEVQTETRQQIALTEERIRRLKLCREKKPGWTSYDKYADAQVGIGIRIEEK